MGDAIGADWGQEYAWVTGLGPDNPKNYQIWVYRKACVTRTNEPERELDFVAQMLDVSSVRLPRQTAVVTTVKFQKSNSHTAA